MAVIDFPVRGASARPAPSGDVEPPGSAPPESSPAAAAVFAPGVTLVERCTLYDAFRGQPGALVASGLILAEQLPGAPGRPKLQVTYYAGEQVQRRTRSPWDEHRLEVRRVAGKAMEVRRFVSEEEQDRRASERRREQEGQQARQAAVSRARASALRTAGEYRADAARTVAVALTASLDAISHFHLRPRAERPFSIAPGALEEFQDVGREMIQAVCEVLERAEVVGDARTRAALLWNLPEALQ